MNNIFQPSVFRTALGTCVASSVWLCHASYAEAQTVKRGERFDKSSVAPSPSPPPSDTSVLEPTPAPPSASEPPSSPSLPSLKPPTGESTKEPKSALNEQSAKEEKKTSLPDGPSADLYPELDRAKQKRGSPQHFAIEVRFAPYLPRIDDEPNLGGKRPFFDTFASSEDKKSGSVGARVMVGIEFDYQALRIPYVGTFGAGLSVGYTKLTTSSKIASTGEGSNQENSLVIVPFTGVLVLRLDELMRRFSIPIVPYVKGGLGLGYWRAYGPDGTTTVDDSRGHAKGQGITWGTSFSVGGMFLLNWLDPYAARSADENLGINQTYLFAEYWREHLNGLGSANALYVGASTVVFGLAFEF